MIEKPKMQANSTPTDYLNGYESGYNDAIEDYEDWEKQERERKYDDGERFCEWRINGFEEGDIVEWKTKCGNFDYYSSGDQLPRKVKYCSFCGLKIKELFN